MFIIIIIGSFYSCFVFSDVQASLTFDRCQFDCSNAQSWSWICGPAKQFCGQGFVRDYIGTFITDIKNIFLNQIVLTIKNDLLCLDDILVIK